MSLRSVSTVFAGVLRWFYLVPFLRIIVEPECLDTCASVCVRVSVPVCFVRSLAVLVAVDTVGLIVRLRIGCADLGFGRTGCRIDVTPSGGLFPRSLGWTSPYFPVAVLLYLLLIDQFVRLCQIRVISCDPIIYLPGALISHDHFRQDY